MTTIDEPTDPMPTDEPHGTPDAGDPAAEVAPLVAVGKRHGGPRPRKRFSRAQLVADAVTDTPDDTDDIDPDHGEVGTLAPAILTVHDLGIEEALLLAAKLRHLAPLWAGRDAEDAPLEAGTIQDLHVAAALRITTRAAYRWTRDAHHAVANLPVCLALLEEGVFPVAWFTELLRRIRGLPADAQHVIDDTISGWDLSCGPEAFTRNLRTLITELTALLKDPEQEARDGRRVELHGATGDDGIACVSIHGPAPEIAEYVARIDAAARAAQRAQNNALENGTEIPLDPNNTAATTGTALTRGQLRYLITTRGALDTDGIDVPALRYRINITIPALTLLGKTETPGLVDGVTPIPADMARDLAAGSDTWYRILTDPTSGAFLPLPADTYTPTAAMREHLRLRHPVCAAPGCTRPAMNGEIDHVEEYDHHDPDNGGRTAVENLHILCTLHHELKTRRHIDPTRGHNTNDASPDTEHGPSLDSHSEQPDDETVEAPPPRPPDPDPPIPEPDPISDDPDHDVLDNPYTPARLRALRERSTSITPASPRLTAAQARARRRAERHADRDRVRTGHTHWDLGHGINTTTDDDTDLLTPTAMTGLDDAWTDYLTTRHHPRGIAENKNTSDDTNTPPPF